MLGSTSRSTFDRSDIREVLARPGRPRGHLVSAYDSPASTVDGWIAVIDGQTWLADDAVRSYAGDGPLITDDQPRPEYFLLRGCSAHRDVRR